MNEQEGQAKVEEGRRLLQSLRLRKSEGYGPLSAILVTIGIYMGSQLAVGVLLGLFLGILGKVIHENPSYYLDRLEDSLLINFMFVLLVEVISIFLLYLFMKSRGISWRSIGLSKPKSNILMAVPVFGAYFLVLILTMAFIQTSVPLIDVEQQQQLPFENVAGTGPLVMVFVGLVILPALVEEIMVRGFLYSGLVKKFSKYVAAITASLLFALAHLQFFSGEPLLWVAAIDTFILSLFLIGLRELTGNIWAGVLVHGLKNSLAFVSLYILHIN